METYINTGNVRLTHSARSVAKVQAALEKAYAAEAGFEVPTIVFTTKDLAALTARAEELHAEHDPAGQHYVTLYSAAPTAAAARRPPTRSSTRGRPSSSTAAPPTSCSTATSTPRSCSPSKEFKALGKGTARTVKVLRTVTEKWC